MEELQTSYSVSDMARFTRLSSLRSMLSSCLNLASAPSSILYTAWSAPDNAWRMPAAVRCGQSSLIIREVFMMSRFWFSANFVRVVDSVCELESTRRDSVRRQDETTPSSERITSVEVMKVVPTNELNAPLKSERPAGMATTPTCFGGFGGGTGGRASSLKTLRLEGLSMFISKISLFITFSYWPVASSSSVDTVSDPSACASAAGSFFRSTELSAIFRMR
mmetsp:Transcript_106265/g.307694  ORF Transcript_106265/g.307694 Transcript_106265/m.307694 type:complete len:221 (+) Transcript_106265:3047-3709(+)